MKRLLLHVSIAAAVLISASSGVARSHERGVGSDVVVALKGDLFIVSASGGVVRLTRDGTLDEPRVSPDGRSIAFTRRTGYEEYEVVLARLDGQDSTLLDERIVVRGEHPSWSPSGRLLALSDSGIVRVIHASDGRDVPLGKRLSTPGPVLWSGDRNLVVTGFGRMPIVRYDRVTGEVEATRWRDLRDSFPVIAGARRSFVTRFEGGPHNCSVFEYRLENEPRPLFRSRDPNSCLLAQTWSGSDGLLVLDMAGVLEGSPVRLLALGPDGGVRVILSRRHLTAADWLPRRKT